MTPRARSAALEVVEQPDGLLVRDLDSNREHTLHPLTAFVWRHADGETSVADLAARASAELRDAISEEHVWGAIDVLTGAGLMEARVAPPAGAQRLGRRDLLRSVAVGSAAAAAGAIAVTPASAATPAQELAKKVAQEQDQKQAAKERAEDAAKRSAQEAQNKIQQQAKENEAKQAQEQQNKQQQEQAEKKRDPFTEIALGGDWSHFGGGFAPLAWERRGPHIHLVGLIEFTGEPEFNAPPDGDLPTLAGNAIDVAPPDGDSSPPDPDGDEFDIETMLIGMLPEGARPAATLVFSVASDTLIGTSEVQITADGHILLVLDDESDDQLDAATIAEQRRCARMALRRKRQHARLLARQKRRLLRMRARKARRRCSDNKEVFLTGPSEISLAGISFRAKP